MRPARILAIVQSDLELICLLRGFLEANNYSTFRVARNSQEAILYLRGVGIYQDRYRHPLPSIIILDSVGPNGDDLEVLGWMRQRENDADVPIIILCSEKHGRTPVTCVLDRSCYLVERGNLGDLREALKNIEMEGAEIVSHAH